MGRQAVHQMGGEAFQARAALRWWRGSERVVRNAWLRAGLLAVFGLLLGRASIEHAVFPFALAYFAVLSEVAGLRRSWPALLAIAGAWAAGGWHLAAVIGGQTVVYGLLRHVLFRRAKPDLHWIPFLAGAVAAVVRMAAAGTLWTRYDLMMAGAEGALVVILSLIFLQCLPLLAGRDGLHVLRQEQLVSLTILIGSALSGLAGVVIEGVSVVQAVMDYIVLMLAFAGGTGAGTAASVVVGVLALLSHAQTLSGVAVLAFAGLMAGVLKDAGRWLVGMAFLLSLGVLTLSVSQDWNTLFHALAAAGIAAVLFWTSPGRWREQIALLVPGTAEHRRSEQDRVRRIQHLLSGKIEQMSQVFDELAATFADTGDNPLHTSQQLLDQMIGSAARSVCAGCARRKRCWEQEGIATYQAMTNTIAKLEARPGPGALPSSDLRERCIRIDPLMAVLRRNLEITARDAQWLEKMREQKTLVAAQLAGVAHVIRGIAAEIERDRRHSLEWEERILAALEQLGLYVDHVHIVSLDPGKVEIEVVQPSAGAHETSVRVIAPLLSGVLGENITVSRVSEGSGPFTAVFTSAREYDVETAVASVARGGRMVSGDSHTAVDLGNGRYAIAVSDGMGNGEQARRQSKAATELLKKLLAAGFDEQLAVRTVNSTLLLRSREESFTTLDLALIDLFSARTEFLKIGAAPSYIKRGRTVTTIAGANVPIGILQDIEVQSIEEDLQDGDLLILVSDGIYDAAQHMRDKDEWLRTQIEQLETDDPQGIADTLLEAAVRLNGGEILDDMTVLVARIRRHQPEWAAIQVPGVVGLRHADRQARRRGA
jgi:stage II sporulation protein E